MVFKEIEKTLFLHIIRGKFNSRLKNTIYKKILIFSMVLVLLFNMSTVVLADDQDEDDFINENWVNEINGVQEKNIISSSNQGKQKPVLNSKKYVIFDRKSGLSIYGKDERKQTAMASTTKIMTRYCSA